MTRLRPISFFELDVRQLKRDGCLAPGAQTICREHVNGFERSHCEVTAGRNYVDLAHCGRRQSVALTSTPANLGGTRVWFCCPSCDRRVAILYGSPFACRTCHGLACESQRETAHSRRIRRAVAARRSLGGSGSLLEPIPERPKGMHLSTYWRAQARCVAAERRSIAASAARLGLGCPGSEPGLPLSILGGTRRLPISTANSARCGRTARHPLASCRPRPTARAPRGSSQNARMRRTGRAIAAVRG